MAINRYSLLALIVLPLILYYSTLGFYVLDIPKADDYGDSLRTFIDIKQADDLKTKSQIFFKQHVDHRTSVSRSVYFISLALFNRIDYSILIFVGNAALLIIVLVIYRCLTLSASKPVVVAYMIPVTYLVFQPSAYVSMFWAMAALSNYLVMLWALLCFYFLTRHTTGGVFLSLLCAGLASFTQGNGIGCLGIGLFYLLLSKKYKTDPRVNLHIGLWLIVSAVIVAAFSWGFHLRAPMEFPQGSEALAAHFKLEQSPLEVVHWMVAIFGSAVAHGSLSVATIVGVIVVGVLGTFLRAGIYRLHPALSLYVLFILLSVSMVAVLRSDFFTIQISQSPRYTFYSSQLLAVLAAVGSHYLLVRSNGKATGMAVFILGVSILVSGASYFGNMGKIREQQYRVLNGMWLWNSKARKNPYAPLVANPGATLVDAKKAGIYTPPPLTYLPKDQWGRFAIGKSDAK